MILRHSLTVTLLVSVMCTAWASRFEDYTKQYKAAPDQAKVVTSTCIGGPGVEWLVGGGFQPDGTVVAVGTALGPTLSVAGVEAKVIGGADTLNNIDPKVVMLEKDGKPQIDPKTGNEIYHPYDWAHPNATTYVVLFTPDAKAVKSVVRFPWLAAGATSALVDAEGAIYVTGVANEGISKFSPDSKELTVDMEKIGTSKQIPRHFYLAKISADVTKVLWVRHFTGPGRPPAIALNKKGNIQLSSVDIRLFDTAGTQLSVITVPSGLGNKNAVNPIDGTYAYGGEHNWGTGREPWRCPILNIYDPDGKERYHLYDWGGPFVGMDELRLVSDTAVRSVDYDEDGNLVVTMWSDGGNSPALRDPKDIYKAAKMPGLGYSSWGAGVLSLAYIVKIETKNCSVIGGTMLCSFIYKFDAAKNSMVDKPNGLSINTIGFGEDGVVAVGGGSAFGLIQTGNNLNTGTEPGGPMVMYLNKDMSRMRFSSVMPACGSINIRDNKCWAFASGKVNGKQMGIVFTATNNSDTSYNRDKPAPSLNAVQANYGGGIADGHMTIIDLTDPTVKNEVAK